MRAFTAVAVVMQEIQRENLGDKRYSVGINIKESNLSLAFNFLFSLIKIFQNLNSLHRVDNLRSVWFIFSLN